MALSDQLLADISSTITTPWNTRSGQQIPNTDGVALAGGAVEIDATFLYADLANSSKMAKELDRRIAAKILKAFLAATSRLIRENDGKVVSFDGDRVMGVFYVGGKNSNAAKCALQINWAVKQIREKFSNTYSSVRDASFLISHGVGVDTGTVLAVRAGARGANDLIWIGRAPNLAAKLSDIRDVHYKTHITASVYNSLLDSSKTGGINNENMWQRVTWTFLGESMFLYRSSWRWQPA